MLSVFETQNINVVKVLFKIREDVREKTLLAGKKSAAYVSGISFSLNPTSTNKQTPIADTK